MKVRHFSYNGFSGTLSGGYANYTAEFLKWTSDPGIAECKCSDGQIRRIPSFALDGKIEVKQEKTGVMFGAPSCS
jgi:hypothetical protein